MSIQSEIDRIENNVAATYSNLEEMGADMPETQNTNNLPETVLTVKAVRYDEQSLSEAQKTQARNNIGAASAEEVSAISQEIADLKENGTGGGSSVQPDYAQTDSTQPDFIKNKIVGEVVEYGDTLTWDGDTTGLDSVDLGNACAYHISSAVPTYTDFSGGCKVVSTAVEMEFAQDAIMDDGNGFLVDSEMFFFISPADNYESEGLIFPKKGVYFNTVTNVMAMQSLTIPGYSGFATKTVKKLTPEYMEPFESVTEETDTLTWDGDTSGLVQLGEGIPLYKVSDATPTFSDLENGFTIHNTDIGEGPIDVDSSLMSTFLQQTPAGTIVIGDGVIGIVPSDNFTDADMGITNAKKGVYFSKQSDSLTLLLTIPGYTFTKTSEKIKEEYLPAVEWDKVLNKPFGIDWDNPTVLVDNQTCVISDGMGVLQDVYFGAGLYKIIFDGVTYIRTAVENNGFILGNGAIAGLPNDTGEPFFIGCSQGICILGGTEGEHTLSLIQPVVNKIDTMFYDTKKVFYHELGSDFYLYKDLKGTKATLEELIEAVYKGVVEVSYGGYMYSSCKFVSIEGSYGIVVIGSSLVNGALVDKVLYTAEYTP